MKHAEVTLPVYRHEKRPQWGAAILAWERGDKRGYLFEDGTLRVIGEPYYSFMQLTTADVESLSNAFLQQLAQLERAAAGASDRGEHVLFTVEEQAQLLVTQFPEGFSGDAWQKRHRIDASKKPLKRHRDAAIERARAVLDPKRVARAVTDNQHAELWGDICGLLRSTDLVAPRDTKTFERRIPMAERGLTIALSGVLHNDGSVEAQKNFEEHFAVFVRELTQLLGKAPTWQVATSLLALYSPKKYVCVHPSSLRQQLKWMSESALRPNPNPLDFERANALARGLLERLAQLGLGPVDFFDVYDFVRATTTPSAKQRLNALRRSSSTASSGDAGSNDESPSGNDSDKEAA